MYSGVDSKAGANSPMCFACLSSDRKLQPLGPNGSLFCKIFDNVFTFHQSSISLCWECTATLRKMRLFKEKVDHAQMLLSFHCMSRKDIPPISLSTLTTTPIDPKTDITVSEQSERVKPEVYVKIETGIYNDGDLDTFAQNDDYDGYEQNVSMQLEDIKMEDGEVLLKIKKCKNPKVSKVQNGKKKHLRRYKRVRCEVKGIAEKRIPICYSQVAHWMEKDRNSDFFKKMKHDKCEKCVIRLYPNMKNHMKEEHSQTPKRPLTCDLCLSTFATKPALVGHVRSHRHLRQCASCRFTCYNRDRMRRHLAEHKRAVQCRTCGWSLPSVAAFSDHYRDLHTKFVCDSCGKKCNSKKRLEVHVTRNHLPLICKPCNATFKTYNSYQGHKKLKHVKQMTEEAFCVLCNKQFENPARYRNHVNNSVAHQFERKAGVKKEKIPCPECPRTYMKRQSMLNHWHFVHRNESKYTCRHCGLLCLNRTKLVNHVRFKHEGAVREKNKLCTICGRGFATNRILTHHVRTHTGERPHQCAHCGAKFAQRYAMHSHVKFVHLKEKRRPAYSDAFGGE